MRTARLLAAVAMTLGLAGCAAAEPEVDIDALADEMRPLVAELAQLTYEDVVPADAYFVDTTHWCGNPSTDDDQGKHRYYEYIPRHGMEAWGANGYTVTTLTEAVREVLDRSGWDVVETDRSDESAAPSPEFVATLFEARPDGGGAYLRVSVYGTVDRTLTFNLLAMTACVTAPVD